MRTVFASRLAPVVGGASIAVNPWVKEEKIFQELVKVADAQGAKFVTVSLLRDGRNFLRRNLKN